MKGFCVGIRNRTDSWGNCLDCRACVFCEDAGLTIHSRHCNIFFESKTRDFIMELLLVMEYGIGKFNVLSFVAGQSWHEIILCECSKRVHLRVAAASSCLES